MPAYDEDAAEEARRAMAQVSASQLWFTYRDVRAMFGVSRATIARRMRDKLVPGIRVAGASVIEDGAVRRFDRDQLYWLLLALRRKPRRAPSA